MITALHILLLALLLLCTAVNTMYTVIDLAKYIRNGGPRDIDMVPYISLALAWAAYIVLA
jgi:hypothetical protein